MKELLENRLFLVALVAVCAIIVFGAFEFIADRTISVMGTPPITERGFPFKYLHETSRDFPPYTEISEFNSLSYSLNIAAAIILSGAIVFGARKKVKA